jgi:hypothetical protein
LKADKKTEGFGLNGLFFVIITMKCILLSEFSWNNYFFKVSLLLALEVRGTDIDTALETAGKYLAEFLPIQFP